ncbi:MAG: protein kinase [bacterium]
MTDQKNPSGKTPVAPRKPPRKRRRTGGLEPLPDPNRISSIGTVHAYDFDVDHEDVTRPGEDLVGERVTSDRVTTTVWETDELELRDSQEGVTPPIGYRYRIVEKLGAGGMSEIYKVRHIHMDKEFALKVIEAQPSLVPRARQLFLREAKTASRLDHPNIVQIIDFGVDERHGAFLVMEYLKGETLHQRLRRQTRLRVHQALEIALQVAEALHYMHGQGFIHCDVKAENVFLCRPPADGRQRTLVKIIDFGLSRPRTSNVRLADIEVGGTPHYMAPELINGESPQPSMDIYALGTLLYEMLTGGVPFVGTLEDVIIAQLQQEPIPPSRLMEEPLESRVEAVILEALQKNPKERQRSMGQVIFQLRTVMEMYNFPGARKRGTTGDKPLIAKRSDPIYQPLVDQSPFPMFQLDTQARIVYANEAFCYFVRTPLEHLRGRVIEDTRIAIVYPSIQTDADRLIRKPSSGPLQRAFSFELKDGTKSSMLCWLVPQLNDKELVTRLHGYIHLLS